MAAGCFAPHSLCERKEGGREECVSARERERERVRVSEPEVYAAGTCVPAGGHTHARTHTRQRAVVGAQAREARAWRGHARGASGGRTWLGHVVKACNPQTRARTHSGQAHVIGDWDVVHLA